MASSSVSYLLLDESYDPVFIPAASLTGAAAVSQNILTRLNLWYGEWWENLSLGLPVFQSILGQLGTQQSQKAMALAIQQQIEQTPYVTSVTSIKFSFESGKFSFTCVVQTAFGEVTVSSVPALGSSLGD
jgi:hypothetical protein